MLPSDEVKDKGALEFADSRQSRHLFQLVPSHLRDLCCVVIAAGTDFESIELKAEHAHL